MNTSETLRKKFINKGNPNNLPIWYYKKLLEVSVDYVIFNLLKEDFVVEINGEKHEITFGVNDNGEIGQSIRYDEHNTWLCSFEVISKGFKEGTWYIVTEDDIDAAEQEKLILKNEEKELEKYRDFHKELVTSFKDDLLIRFKNDYSKKDSKYSEMSIESFRKYLIDMLNAMTVEDYRLVKKHIESRHNDSIN